MSNVDKPLCGRYHVLENLEHGKKCKDEQAGINVWLKPLPKEMATDTVLFDEALGCCEALKTLDHPNIARMFGIVRESDDSAYMVMEYVEGVTLRQWMHEHSQNGTVPSRTAIPILEQLASALDKAHSFNEIHRHLTPDCIMVDKDDQVKILNFAIPRVGSDNYWMLEPWNPSGWEAYYRAPEQWRGQLAGPWTDMYALGCITYEMFSGHVPLDIPEIQMLRQTVLEEKPPIVINLSTAAQKTIARCLAKNGGERFRNCMDYVNSLAFETMPTGSVPKTGTGVVLKQPTDRVAAASAKIPKEAFIPPIHGKESLKATTKHIPIVLPDAPRATSVRNTATSLRNTTRAVDGSGFDMSTSHVLSADGEPEFLPWEDKVFSRNKTMSLFFKSAFAIIFFVAVAGVLFFFMLRNTNQVEVEHLLDDQVIDEVAKEKPEYADKLNDPIVRQRIRNAAYQYMEFEGEVEGNKAAAVRQAVHEVMQNLQEEEKLDSNQGDGSGQIQVIPHDNSPVPHTEYKVEKSEPKTDGKTVEPKQHLFPHSEHFFWSPALFSEPACGRDQNNNLHVKKTPP